MDNKRKQLFAASTAGLLLALFLGFAIFVLPGIQSRQKALQLKANFYSIVGASNRYLEDEGTPPPDYATLISSGYLENSIELINSDGSRSYRVDGELVDPFSEQPLVELKPGDAPVNGGFVMIPARWRSNDTYDLVYVIGFGQEVSDEIDCYLDLDSNGVADPVIFCFTEIQGYGPDGCFTSEALRFALARAGFNSVTVDPQLEAKVDGISPELN